MQADIKESEQAEHPAVARDLGLVEDLAEGRDGQRDEQEADGPSARVMRDVFDGIGGELGRIAGGGEHPERAREQQNRNQAQQENRGLGPAAAQDLAEKLAQSRI